MRTYRRVALTLAAMCLAAGLPSPAWGSTWNATGPGPQTLFSPDGYLRLGTHWDVSVNDRSTDTVFQELFQRFPDTLPRPAGLQPRTRVWTFGTIRVMQRTWRWHQTPVVGLSLTIHLDPRGHVRVISAPGIGFGPERRLEPAVPEDQARDEAEALIESALPVTPIATRARLVIQADPTGLTSTWIVGVDLPPPWPPVGVHVDAGTGEITAVYRRASTLGARPLSNNEAYGSVFEESYLDGDTVEVPLHHLEGDGTLTGEFVDVWQYDPDNPPTFASQWVGTESGGAWYFDFPPTEVYTSSGPTVDTQDDAFASVMMYYHVDRVHDFFNTLGYYNDDPLVGIDRSMQATVNYRTFAGYYDNAYYTGPSGTVPGQIVFGQGEATDFSYDASVIYHEYGHAVVDGSSDYVNYCISDLYGSDCTQGGLNEGTADYFSAALRNDPTIGAYALGEWLPQYVRNLTDSNRCPEDLYGEEHEDGKVWGGGLWDVRTAVAGGNQDAAMSSIDPVILATITTPLSSDTEAVSAFSQAASILLTDAEIQFGSGSRAVDAVSSALMDRGLLACSRFVPLRSGETKEGAFSTATRPGRQSLTVAGLQYVVEVTEHVSEFSFTVASEAGLENLTLYVRKDHPVEFTFSGNVLEDVTADRVFEGTTSFSLDAGSDPPLEPGTYYVTFSSPQTLSTALWGHYYAVSATVAGSFEPEEHVTEGCGCVHDPSGDPSSSGTLLLAFGILAWLVARTRLK